MAQLFIPFQLSNHRIHLCSPRSAQRAHYACSFENTAYTEGFQIPTNTRIRRSTSDHCAQGAGVKLSTPVGPSTLLPISDFATHEEKSPTRFTARSLRSFDSGFLREQPTLQTRQAPQDRGLRTWRLRAESPGPGAGRRALPELHFSPFLSRRYKERPGSTKSEFSSVLSALGEQGGQKRECSEADRAVTWEPLAIS